MAYAIPINATNDVIMIVKNAGSGGIATNVYSTTPQQIGLWIDGETPVWREAIAYEIQPVDISDGSTSAGMHLRNPYNAIFLNVRVDQCRSLSNFANSLMVEFGIDQIREFWIDEDGYNIDGLGYLVGVVEYVTPVSNIKT